jgi:hypothetical protein
MGNPIRKVHLDGCLELLQREPHSLGTFLGYECRNPSFGLATKAKGNCKGAGQRKARELSQEEARELSQEDARKLRQEEARESHHILPGV